MSHASEVLERGLALFAELVGEDAPLEDEFRRSRARFSGGAGGSPDPAAGRRHLEWFVLERPSPHLDGVPADVLRSAWCARAGEPELDLADAFLHSRAGAFEVTSVEDAGGLWVRDLAALGEYPIDESEAASQLRPGDLLVGRLFPVGEGLFALSPAMALFRDERLLRAVRADLERMREARRGVLRIEQLELERLFFPSTPDGARAGSLEARLEDARTALVAIGLAPEAATETVERVARAEHERAVTEILNELAFDTDVDLGRAQRTLAALWSARRHATAQRSASRTGQRSEPREAVAPGSAGGVRDALEAFDRGRAKGRDLDQLIDELAETVGVDMSDDAGDDDARPTPTPDFPGVVGAMVEEFLWDVGRERGEPTARRLAALRRLSRWGADIGVFENLGRRDLLTFAGRWLLDEGDLAGPEEAHAVLDALAEFCRWCEERHAHPLWTEFASSWKPLAVSVPRLVRARRTLGPPPADARPHQVVGPGAEDTTLVLRDESGTDVPGRVPAALRDLLRPGDGVHAALGSDGTWRIAACYPGELRELLRDP